MADDAVAIRRARVGPALLGAVRAVPVWAWLVGLVLVSTLVRYAFARKMAAPWIMIDELIYSELAKSFAGTGHFLIRDQPSDVYGFVYPVLISPAWALFDRVPDAYAAAKAINALMISLAAVPAYFLARRVLSPWLSLLAATLTVAVPSMVYAGTLMTENAFYPLLLTAALATVVWLERPTATTTALVLAASLLCFVTPLGVLGAYEAANTADYTVREVSRWFLYHVAGLDLSLGIVPFAALLLLAITWRGRSRTERVFLAGALSITFWLVLEVATFASEQSFRIEERNMFYVAPLFFIALLVWIDRGSPRPLWPTVVAVVAAAALALAIPYVRLVGLSALSDTISLLPLASLHDSGVPLADLRWIVFGGAVLAGAIFVLVPARYALILPVLVVAYFAVSQKPIEGKWREASTLDLFQGITIPRPDWIDRKVGRDADVAAIWSGVPDRFSIWENEFFNRSLRRFYYTQGPLPGDLPETALTTDLETGVMRDPSGKVVRAEYVLTDGSVALAGRVIALDLRKGTLLYRVNGPLRRVSHVEGLYPQDTWSGAEVTYTRLGCAGGALAVELQSDPGLFTRPQTVVAYVGGKAVARVSVPPVERRVLHVPLRGQGGTCVVRFRISQTAVPKVVTRGANPDPRRLGVHFNRFSYSP